jgi:hypothetical protein
MPQVVNYKILKEGVAMYSDVNKELAKERVRRTLAEAEQRRLAQKVGGDRKAWDGWKLATLALGSLLGIVVVWLA